MRVMNTVGAASLIGAMLVLAGCGGGGGGDGTVAGDNPTTTTTTTTTTVSTTTTTTAAPVTVTVTNIDQSGTLATQPAADQPTGSWQTAEALKLINPASLKADVNLIAQLDSSGPDAWDASAHPIIYVATDGPGYGGLLAKDWDPKTRQFVTDVSKATAPMWQGLAIFDAATHQAVTSAFYPNLGPSPKPDAEGSENHGLGASQDGKWFYTQGNDSRSTYSGHNVLNVINARTLKVDKIINTRAHHVRTVHDADTGKDLVLVDAWNNQFYLLDPTDDNKIIKAVSPSDLNGAGYLAFVDYSGKWLFISTRTGFSSEAGVTVINLKTMKVATRINTEDASPIWVTFSVNGQYAYVSGGHASTITRIDMSDPSPGKWRAESMANAGVQGPYGLSLNWENTIVFSSGKNEGGANKGEETGVVPASVFGNGRPLAPVYLNGCIRVDHSVVNPIKASNELWFSCNSSFETVVLDMGDSTAKDWQSYKVKKFNVSETNPMGNLENPSFGSSHGGAFVKYTVSGSNWSGELLSDTNGMHGSAIDVMKAAAAAAGN